MKEKLKEMIGMLKMQDGRIDMILVTTIFVTGIYYVTTPALWIHIYQVRTPDMVSIKNIGMEILSIVFGIIWVKYGDKLYRHYGKILFLECGFAVALLVVTWTSLDLQTYYIIDSACIAISTQNVIAGGRKLKARRYPSGEARHRFDQMNSVCASFGVITGSMLGLYVQPHVGIRGLITVYLTASLADNICYYCIYKKMQKENTESVNA